MTIVEKLSIDLIQRKALSITTSRTGSHIAFSYLL